MSKDYYKILGVEKNASQEDLKKAFRKLAHQYHPDKKGGDEAKFKEVNEAYQVLSDASKRANYDRTGSADGNPFGQGGGYGGFQGGFQQGDFGDFGNINDIFSDFFGGGGQREQVRRGRDVQTEITISFEESVFGAEKRIRLHKTASCATCKGLGAKPGTKMKQCSTCKGQGKVQHIQKSFLGSFATVRTCADCGGSGSIPEERCTHCKGSGVEKRDQEITVTVPAGIEHGQTLRLPGMGEAISKGQAGDLYILVRVAAHPTFTRAGTNLLMDLPIKLSDALLGAEYDIKTLDGMIALKIPEGIIHGEVLRIKGKGVAGGSRRGDILVTVKIQFPKKLTRDQRAMIEKLKEEGI